jgi:hypothetical protein
MNDERSVGENITNRTSVSDRRGRRSGGVGISVDNENGSVCARGLDAVVKRSSTTRSDYGCGCGWGCGSARNRWRRRGDEGGDGDMMRRRWAGWRLRGQWEGGNEEVRNLLLRGAVLTPFQSLVLPL